MQVLSKCARVVRRDIRANSPLLCGLVALAACLPVLLPAHARAADLFGVVSDRNAASMVEAAQRFTQQHPGHRVVLRSTEQVATLTDGQLAALWKQADAVLVAAVFGDQAERLTRLLGAHPPKPGAQLLALHSAQPLTQASRLGDRAVFEGLSAEQLQELTTGVGASATDSSLETLVRRFPKQADWLRARRYWIGGGPEHQASLLAFLLQHVDPGLQAPEPPPTPSVQWLHAGAEVPPRELAGLLRDASGTVAVLDYAGMDGSRTDVLHRCACDALARQQLSCVSVFARWGDASVQALEQLVAQRKAWKITGLVVLQDFVIGGGSGRKRASEALRKLDVPVIKAVRMADRSEAEWKLSEDGLPWDSLHYRVAMPELQGQGQPFVVAAAGPRRIDQDTGLAFRTLEPIDTELESMAERLGRWAALRRKPNAKKRVAVIYYNHPPGRHNVGADNLDVPQSLWEVLRALRKAGYDVQDAPATPEALLDSIQERGVNLPEDGEALRAMAGRVATLPAAEYASWFHGLPDRARTAMSRGPLAVLQHDVTKALGSHSPKLATGRVERVLGDVSHLLEGVDHPARARALDLSTQLSEAYDGWLNGRSDGQRVADLTGALERTGIEGLRGWGKAPGNVMVHDDALLVPGMTYGNVFVGPQPPRGWELNEELLHANLAFPPTHQYLAYYHYLREVWKADVVVHLGRHSTYEFLPGRRAGLSAEDFPRLVLGDLPSVYVYIVDGVGEGIQAKRRGQAVIVDHLTPPLSTTPLYDQLLELRQLVESYEARSGNPDAAAREHAVREIRRLVDELELRDELVHSMQGELDVRGIGFDEVDGDLLVHEVGHYLTQLQERFMPYGLHVFGRPWKPDAVKRMWTSMTAGQSKPDIPRSALTQSPRLEREALLAGLEGRFVQPGHGNDPVRTPHALPTGRNFHALDGGLIPTRAAHALGTQMAERARAEGRSTPQGAEAVVLWASDTVRDEGAMVSFGLDMLGLAPVWNSRGILTGLTRIGVGAPVEGQPARVRRDVSFVTSGLFRDLYPNLLVWLDRAVLLTLDASSQRIAREFPELKAALHAALAPLDSLRKPGDEPLTQNEVAAHWVAQTRASLAKDAPPAQAGRDATLRVFGNAAGGYGAGVNRLAERSGAWTDRKELAQAYVHRMGHAYGIDLDGVPAHKSLQASLARTERTYLGRASHLYGLLDNNDGFDFLGGLGLATESLRGQAPEAHVVQHANPSAPRLEALEHTLMQELRGRHLNPEYLQALMQHGYAGARTLSAGFVENLWGWQVTSPEIIKPWVWDEVNRVLLEDGHDLGLDEFLSKGHNVQVRTNLQAILLVAALREFWDASDETLDALSQAFAQAVVDHGLPGSGHTRPDHPVMDAVAKRLDASLREAFEARLRAAQTRLPAQASDPAVIAELEASDPNAQGDQEANASSASSPTPYILLALLALGAGLLAAGFIRGRRG